MKHLQFEFAASRPLPNLLLLALVAVLAAPAREARGAGFEQPNPLRSAAYLAADQLAGADFKVEPQATTDGFATTYTVTSRFGTWPARGRMGVALRIREIQALAELEEVSKSDVFLDAVKNSATAPLQLVQAVATKPVETLKGVPAGVGRWMKKTSFQVKEGYHDAKEVRADLKEGQKEGEAAGDSTTDTDKANLTEKGKEEATKYALDYLKISGAELKWYAKLGVDPYTDNEILRKAVTSVARVEGLTSFGMKFVGMPSIPGASEARKTMDLVWKTDPWELRLANRKKLLAAGLTEETARSFEDNRSMSLSQQTALLQTLDQLAGVPGRETVIARAIDLASREEASQLVSSLALLSRFHKQQVPLREFLAGTRLPVARTTKGALVGVILSDALFWTEEVAPGAKGFAEAYAGDPAKERQLWVVGEASPTFKSGAASLGWEVRDRWQLQAPEDAATGAAR
jgi:hypothetical protein